MNYEDQVTKEYVENALASAGSLVKLKEVTTAEDLSEVDIDLSDIDTTQFCALKIYCTVNAQQVGVRLNDATTFYSKSWLGSNDTSSSSFFVTTLSRTPAGPINGELTISGMQGGTSSPVWGMFLAASGIKIEGSLGLVYLDDVIRHVKFAQTMSSFDVKSGSKFLVYGVRMLKSPARMSGTLFAICRVSVKITPRLCSRRRRTSQRCWWWRR